MRRSPWRAGSARRSSAPPKLVREAVGADSPIEAGGGRSRPARTGATRLRGLASSKVCRPPLEEAVPLYVDWLRRHPAAQGRTAPLRDRRSASRSLGGASRSPLCRRTSQTRAPSSAPSTTLAATDGRSLALTAEAPVAWPSGAFVRVGRLTDEAQACVEPLRRLRRRNRLPGADAPPLRAAGPGRVPRPARARRGRAPPLPPLLRGRLSGAGRRPAGRKRPAGAADANRRDVPLGDRRPLARPPARGSWCRARLHAGHVARGALRQLRLRVPERLRPQCRTRSSSSTATSTSSATHRVVAHISDAHGLLGEGLPRSRRARPRPGRGGSPRRPRPLSRRRSPSPIRPARPT